MRTLMKSCHLTFTAQYFAEGRDLEHINNQTKVVWASSPSIFMFKPRDYCTYVHYRKHADGTIIGACFSPSVFVLMI